MREEWEIEEMRRGERREMGKEEKEEYSIIYNNI